MHTIFLSFPCSEFLFRRIPGSMALDCKSLRKWFQYTATVDLSAEICCLSPKFATTAPAWLVVASTAESIHWKILHLFNYTELFQGLRGSVIPAIHHLGGN